MEVFVGGGWLRTDASLEVWWLSERSEAAGASSWYVPIVVGSKQRLCLFLLTRNG